DLVGLPVGRYALKHQLLSIEARWFEWSGAHSPFVGVLHGVLDRFPYVLGNDGYVRVSYPREHISRGLLELERNLVAAAADVVKRLPDAVNIECGLLLEQVNGEYHVVGAERLTVVPFHSIADGEDQRLRVLPLVIGRQPRDDLTIIAIDDHQWLKNVVSGQPVGIIG